MNRPDQFDEKTRLMISVDDQYEAALNGVAFVDRSAIGRIEVTGNDAIDLLHRLSTQNLLQRKRGEVVGSVFTTDIGRIVDYVHIVFREESLLLLTSPACEQSFISWIDKFTIMEDIHNKVVTSSTSMITLIGPGATAFTEHVFGTFVENNRVVETEIYDRVVTIVCREEFQTQFIDLICDSHTSLRIKKIIGTTESGIAELSENTFELFRISRGMPAHGHELSDSFNPYEVNLRHAISFTKGCYLGQEVIARLDTYQKIQKQAFGIVFGADDIPEAGSIAWGNAGEVGVLTSVSPDALRGKRIAIGVLRKNLVNADDNISVVSNGNTLKGVVRRFPMVL